MGAAEGPSIAELLVRARQNDADLGRLFLTCRHYLEIIARNRVVPWLRAKVDPSDIVQETLLEAYRDFGGFRGDTEEEWLAWLRGILEHNAANFVRRYRGTAKRQAERELVPGNPADSSDAGPLAAVADRGETPCQHLLRSERALELTDALARLSPDHREVIVLRNLQRLSFQEVAQHMERSRPAVQMLWTRAIHMLRQVLTDAHEEPG